MSTTRHSTAHRSNRSRKTAGFRMPGAEVIGAKPLPVVKWVKDGQFVSTTDDNGVAQFFGDKRHENAARAVACVNAMSGIKDPAAAIAYVRALLNKIQWVGCDTCPECGNDEEEGHAEECNLASALRALGGQP